MTRLLAYFPSPPQGVWHLGPLPVRAYALFIIAGIVAALIIGDRRWAARGGERGVIYDIALWAVPFGLLGGRLYHLATDWRTYWGPGGAGFGAALRIWDGGLGIWGAVALGGVGAWIACRRHGIPLPAFGDAIAPGIILAQAIGRLGNYFNQELYGRETTLPWGLEIFYRRDPSGYVDPHSLDGVSTGQVAMVVQPTFLYELIWNLIVFALLLYLDRRYTLGHGRLFALYVAGYCVGRFGVELLRDDTATHIAGIRINSFTSTFVFIGAVVYFMLAPKGREDPESLRGNAGVVEVQPEAAAAAATTTTDTDEDATTHTEAAEPADASDDDVPEPDTVTAAAASDTEEPEPAEAQDREDVPAGEVEDVDEPDGGEPEPSSGTADEANETEDTDEAEDSDEADETEDTDGADETEDSDESDDVEAPDDSEESDEPEGSDESDDVEAPDETDETHDTDETEDSDEPEDAAPAPTAGDVTSTAVEFPASHDEAPRRRWGLRRKNRS